MDTPRTHPNDDVDLVARAISAAMDLARNAAPCAPSKTHAMVAWSGVDELRDALDAAQLEWRR